MFTGLIQSKGRVEAVSKRGGELRLTIRPLIDKWDAYIQGESIAVNGACLTVDGFTTSSFSAYASAETVSRTNLGPLKPGDEVNLERALRMGDSMGGHMVSGHVDEICRVSGVTPSGESVIYRFDCSDEQSVFIIPKGSVAVDGISLTVNACGPGYFEVNVIPATRRETTMASWKPGRDINLETDLIGKYVARMLDARRDSPQAQESAGSSASGSVLDEEFFRRNGF